MALKAPDNGLGIGETIRRICETGSWAALKNIEQVPAYNALLLGLLEELRPVIETRTGAMLRPQGFVFITSPNGVTPYHFDPEHNVLMHLTGSKTMTLFPQGNTRFAPDESARKLSHRRRARIVLEAGSGRWRNRMAAHAR